MHVDPHEGNILLTDDGRIAFLDFGLMGHVPAFARGSAGVRLRGSRKQMSRSLPSSRHRVSRTFACLNAGCMTHPSCSSHRALE